MSVVELPIGWAHSVLGEVADIVTGTTPLTSRSDFYGGDIPFIKPGNLLDRPIDSTEDTISQLGQHHARIVPELTVLVSCIGNLGKTGITVTSSAINQQINAVTFAPGIVPKYGLYFCQTLESYLVSVSSATTISIVNKSKFSQAPFLLPPSKEQRRIVAEIETQLTRLDASVAALKRALANLKRYRASVLKAACSGALLPRQSLSRNEARDLPSEWSRRSIEQLASTKPRSIQSGPFGSALLHSEFQEHGILAIGIDNVLEGRFSMGRQHRISEDKFQQLSRFQARPGDVLITVMATVGRCCVIPNDIERAIVTKHVYRITVNQELILPNYLLMCLMGESSVREQLFGEVKGQTRPGINGEILRRLMVPVPPVLEQHGIVAEVERRLSMVDEMERTIDHGIQRAEKLRQAILQKAFAGELVPQDPNDEPASVLLERIKAERTASAATKPSRKPRAKKGQLELIGE